MALIQCPVCNKQISSKASQCPHCRADLSANSESSRRINHIQQSTRLLNHSFIALTLFIGGVVIWFWGGEPAEGLRANIAGISFTLGLVGYIVTRIRMILHKRKSI